jgi:hypothetical protein
LPDICCLNPFEVQIRDIYCAEDCFASTRNFSLINNNIITGNWEYLLISTKKNFSFQKNGNFVGSYPDLKLSEKPDPEQIVSDLQHGIGT